jgi:hypothetical protein
MIKIYNLLFESNLAILNQISNIRDSFKLNILKLHLDKIAPEKAKQQAANFLKNKFPILEYNNTNEKVIENIKKELKDQDLENEIKEYFKTKALHLKGINLFKEKNIKDLLDDSKVFLDFSNDPDSQKIYYKKIIEYISSKNIDNLMSKFFLKH